MQVDVHNGFTPRAIGFGVYNSKPAFFVEFYRVLLRINNYETAANSGTNFAARDPKREIDQRPAQSTPALIAVALIDEQPLLSC